MSTAELRPSSFDTRLGGLTTADIGEIGNTLRSYHSTAEGEVAWWRATISVDSVLRRHHLTRRAALAAHEASTVVLATARRAGMVDAERDTVTAVARAAADAARALVAEAKVGLPTGEFEPLLGPWAPRTRTMS